MAPFFQEYHGDTQFTKGLLSLRSRSCVGGLQGPLQFLRSSRRSAGCRSEVWVENLRSIEISTQTQSTKPQTLNPSRAKQCSTAKLSKLHPHSDFNKRPNAARAEKIEHAGRRANPRARKGSRGGASRRIKSLRGCCYGT